MRSCVLVLFFLPGILHSADHGVEEVPKEENFCRDYLPGMYLSADLHRPILNDLWKSFPKQPSERPNPQEMSRSLEQFRGHLGVRREAFGALNKVLLDPQSKVFFSSYSDPKSPDFDSDGGKGLRIVWQLEVPVKGSRGGEEKRLISVICFMKYDVSTHRMEFTGGADALRIRVQIAPYRPAQRGQTIPFLTHTGFLETAFSLSQSTDGKISNLDILRPFDRSTGRPVRGAPPMANPNQCNTCHNGEERARASYEDQKGPIASEDWRRLVADIRSEVQGMREKEKEVASATGVLSESPRNYPAFVALRAALKNICEPPSIR